MLYVLAAAAVLRQAVEDLPVHCEHWQVYGEWDFYVGVKLNEEGKEDPNCGYSAPDKPLARDGLVPRRPAGKESPELDGFRQLPGERGTFQATLGAVWQARGGPRGASPMQGKWTLVYDEALHVGLEDPDGSAHSFLAFLWYDPTKAGNANTVEEKAAISQCSGTLLGWYKQYDPTTHKVKESKCFYGVQKPSTFRLRPRAPSSGSDPASLLEAQPGSPVRMAGFGHTGREEAPVEADNEKEAERAIRADKKDMLARLAELARGEDLPWKRPGWAADGHKRAHFDWREETVGGVTGFVPGVFSQTCGTCFAVATTSMVTSRLWIRYPALKHRWAKQGTGGKDIRAAIEYVRDCDVYNQGCDGGFPYLIAYDGYFQGWPTSECYEGAVEKHLDLKVPDPEICSEARSCPELIRPRAFYHVGGAYPRCNAYGLCEELMREEIYRGGPIVCPATPKQAFEQPDEGQVLGSTYKLTRDPRGKEACPKLGEDCYVWVEEEHTLLCVGWGEENGEKYWIVQNSWGEDWERGGFAKVERGHNVGGIETTPVAVEPEMLDCQGAKGCTPRPYESEL